MSFTAANVLSDARVMVHDEDSIRWSDGDLLAYVNRGLEALWAKRPDAFFVEGIVVDPPTALTSTSNAVPLLDRWRVALTHWVAYECLSEDDDDASNQALATNHLQKALTGVG